MNNDRIAEVYDGTFGSAPQQRIARARIHWMCRQVRGQRALDIGCSQGIVALLLAREGTRVVGIDREAAAIAEAQRRLELEEEVVRQRVRFIQAEGLKLDLPKSSFDTVLLGEVIEHQLDSRPLLDEARRLLRPRGTLVLTAPYGIFPYPDHKEPIYLGSLIELLSAHFRVGTVELIDRYVGIVATPSAKPTAPSDLWKRVFELAEQRLAEQDRAVERLQDEIGRLRTERTAAQAAAPSDRLESLLEGVEQIVERVEELESERVAIADALRSRTEQLARAWAEHEALLSAHQAAQHAIALLRKRLDAPSAVGAARQLEPPAEQIQLLEPDELGAAMERAAIADADAAALSSQADQAWAEVARLSERSAYTDRPS